MLNNGTIIFSGKIKKVGKADVEAAQKFFKMLDKDEDGKISRVSLLSDLLQRVKKKKKTCTKALTAVERNCV